MKSILIVLLVVVAPLAATNVFGCSCDNAPTAAESFERVDAVFYGVPESVEERGNQVFAIFRVEKSIKGVDRDRVWVETGITSCDMQFKQGVRQYLFVEGGGDLFRTLPCHRHHGDKIFDDKPELELKSIGLTSNATWRSPSPVPQKTVYSNHGSAGDIRETKSPDDVSGKNQNWELLGLGMFAGVVLVFATLGVFFVVTLFRKK